MSIKQRDGLDARFKRIDVEQPLAIEQRLNFMNECGISPCGGVQLDGIHANASGYGYPCSIPIGKSFELVMLCKSSGLLDGWRAVGEVITTAGSYALNFGNSWSDSYGLIPTFADAWPATPSREWSGKWVQISFGYDGTQWFTTVGGTKYNHSGEIPTNAKPLSIGRLLGGVLGGWGQFHGEVSEMTLYNRALTEIERANWITVLLPKGNLAVPFDGGNNGGAITAQSTTGCTLSNITSYISAASSFYDEPRPAGTKLKISCDIAYTGTAPLDTAKASPRLYNEPLEYPTSRSGTLHVWEFTSASDRMDTWPTITVFCQSGGTAVISNYKVELISSGNLFTSDPANNSQILPPVSSCVLAGTGDAITQTATVTGTVATIDTISSGYAWVYGNNNQYAHSVKCGDRIQVTFNMTSTGNATSTLFGAWRLNNFAENLGVNATHAVYGNKHVWEIDIVYDSPTLFVAPAIANYVVGEVITITDFQVVKKNKGTKYSGELQFRGFKHNHTSWNTNGGGLTLSNVTASSFDFASIASDGFIFADANAVIYLKKGQKLKVTFNLTKTSGDVRGLPGFVLWNYSWFEAYTPVLGEGYNEVVLECPATGWHACSISQHNGVWGNAYPITFSVTDITIDAIGTVASYKPENVLKTGKWIDTSGNAYDLTPQDNEQNGGIHAKRPIPSYTRSIRGYISPVTAPARDPSAFGEISAQFNTHPDFPDSHHLYDRFDQNATYVVTKSTIPNNIAVKLIWFYNNQFMLGLINTSTSPVYTGQAEIELQQILS